MRSRYPAGLLMSDLSQISIPPNVLVINPTGTVTGMRYNVKNNALAAITDGTPTFLPGNSAGVTASGGLYVAWS